MKFDENKLNELFLEDTVEDDAPYGSKIKLNQNEAVATIFDWLGSLFMALVIVLLIMTFGFRIIDVDGKSMEPTLIDTDKVAITDLFYTPHNGDIVIISHAEEYQKPLVKRVIATAGQELRIDYDKNAVYVDNGIVPEGKVFVMGDNRGISLDSRYRQIGFIDESYIIGKAQLDVIPHAYDENGVLKLDLSKIRYVYK